MPPFRRLTCVELVELVTDDLEGALDAFRDWVDEDALRAPDAGDDPDAAQRRRARAGARRRVPRPPAAGVPELDILREERRGCERGSSSTPRGGGCSPASGGRRLRVTAPAGGWRSALDPLTPPGLAAALAGDCAFFARAGEACQAPYVAGCAAGHAAVVAGGSYRDGFGGERAHRSAWITRRLRLDTG